MRFDIGFQLSFMATGGILLVYPLLRVRRFFALPVLGDELATTLSAQIGVWPILLVNFGNLSWFSPVINALVLPLVPLLMYLGGMMVLFGFLIRPVAQVLGWLLWLPLSYFIGLIRLFASVPWVNLEIGGLSWWWAGGYYFVLGAILWQSYRRDRWEKKEPRLF